MKKLIILALAVLLFVGTANAEWKTRYTKERINIDGSKTVTCYIGPQVFMAKDSSFQELNFEDHYKTDGYYLVQNAHIAIEIYDYYAKLYDPDYKAVAVYDERFVPQVLNNKKWKDIGVFNPKFEIDTTNSQIIITRIMETAPVGELRISYIVKPSAFLKHDIVFKNLDKPDNFRVVMQQAGITSNKMTTSSGIQNITAETSAGKKPYFEFGDKGSLKLTEYLWSLGVVDTLTDEWVAITLQGIEVETHAQGSKVNIIIGDYALGYGDSLVIDPTTSTFQVGASTDDCWVNEDLSYISLTNVRGIVGKGTNPSSSAPCHFGLRWTNVTVSQGATIDSAFLSVYGRDTDPGAIYTRIYGDDTDDAATFSTYADFAGRSLTTAYVDWDKNEPSTWTDNAFYRSHDIKTVVQEIVNRGSWSSGNALALIVKDDGSAASQDAEHYTWNNDPADAAKIKISYTTPAAITLDERLKHGFSLQNGVFDWTPGAISKH